MTETMTDAIQGLLDHSYAAKMIRMSSVLPDDLHKNVPVVANVTLAGQQGQSIMTGYFCESEIDREVVFVGVMPSVPQGLEFVLSSVQSYAVLPSMADFIRCGMEM